MEPARLRLGQLLVDARIISQGQLEQVLSLQKDDSRRLGTLLVERGLVNETQLTQILSQQLSVPWVSLYHIDFSRRLLNLVPPEVAQKYCLVPIYVRKVRGQGDTLYVAMDDPTNEDALRECAAWSGLPTRAMISSPSDIAHAVEVYYGIPREKSVPTGISVSPSAKPVPVQVEPVDAAPGSGQPSTEPQHTPTPQLSDQTLTDSPADTEASPPAPSEDASSVAAEPSPSSSKPEPSPQPPTGEALPHVDVLPRRAMPSEADIHVELVESSTEPPPEVVESPPRIEEHLPFDDQSVSVEIGEEIPLADVLGRRPRDAEPDDEPDEVAPVMPKRKGFAFTLLDGTTLPLPLPRAAAKRRPQTIASALREGSEGDADDAPPVPSSRPRISPSDFHAPGQDSSLTSRDVISALRAASHGVDPSDILGRSARWEAMFSALLSLLLQRGIIDDEDFIEELKKV